MARTVGKVGRKESEPFREHAVTRRRSQEGEAAHLRRSPKCESGETRDAAGPSPGDIDAPFHPPHTRAHVLQEIRDSLRDLYLNDPRPWLVGFSGGKDSTLVAALIFETVLALPPEQRTKPTAVLSTGTRVEPKRSGDSPPHFTSNACGQIPAVVERIEATLEAMRACSEAHALQIEVNLLKPTHEQSFWVNMLGRGYPPQRMKIELAAEQVVGSHAKGRRMLPR